MIANILSIAGVDPSGGAGVLADIKTISANGAYAMGVVTALTAQNTRGVSGIELVTPEFVTRQIDAVFDDIRVDAVKIGMVATAEIARAIAAALRRHHARHIVLDPVMIAKSGDRLLAADAVAAIRNELVPLAEVITPNLPETAVLLGQAEPADVEGMRAMAVELLQLGPAAVLLKGGHLRGPEATDVLADADGLHEFTAPRVMTRNTHGTGCTLSSAIAALLPVMPRAEAVRAAKAYLTEALKHADELSVGRGHGPVRHFLDR
jgi:hydroxymethylpyrimidine/phosphomethylpyrimidine kinase